MRSSSRPRLSAMGEATALDMPNAATSAKIATMRSDRIVKLERTLEKMS